MAENFFNFLAAFKNVKQTGPKQYICRCPAHDDRKASLSICDETDSADRILLTCHAGCDTGDILSSVGKAWADIQPTEHKDTKPLQKWQINLTAEYRYKDENGDYLYSKLRYEGPDIDGKKILYGRIVNGEYTKGKGDATGTLYGLAELKKGIEAGKTIYYVEGEKDADTLNRLGLVAVTAGGTGDWKPEFAKYFIGATDVVIVSDNDKPGKELASKVSRSLRSIVYKQRIITPSSITHGDVTDYLNDEGGSIEGLFALTNNAEVIPATWVSDKGKVVPSLLANVILDNQHILIARNPGTKSDQLLWYKSGVYHVCSEVELESAIDKFLPSYISNPTTLKQTAHMVAVRAKAVKYDKVNLDENYINVRNGLIKLPEFKLIPHTPDLISTVQLDCDYDPTATAPTWDKFKADCCTDEDGNIDEEMLRLDKMKLGIILSSMHGYRMKGAFVQYSVEGNTGKSVDCDIITHMLGMDNTANVPFQDMSDDRWATGRCWGKRLIIVGDQGRTSIKDSTTFKQLTGGDPISAELKGLQHFMYRFNGVILVSCNHLPVFEDDKGNHMSERLNFIHWRNVIPEEKRDDTLRDKLKQEASGILNWALEGYKDYLNNNRKLCPCQSSRDLMEEYRQRYDTFYAFISAYCELTKDNSDYIRKTEFELEYEQFCVQNDYTAITKRFIHLRAASQGISLKMKDGIQVYRGVKFKSVMGLERDARTSGFTTQTEPVPF